MDSTQETRESIIAEYRVYFSLLRDYQEENHPKIKQSLSKIRAILHEYQRAAGATATSKLFHECYNLVLSENKWAKTDFWSDR